MTHTSNALLEYAASTSMDAAPAVEIEWTQTQGGDECIGRDDLAAKVQAAIGVPTPSVPPEQTPHRAVVRGSIGRDLGGEGWAAAIEVRRGDGPPLRRELRLTAKDCRQLDETIVLVVEMLLDAAILQKPRLGIENSPPRHAIAIGPDVAVGAGMLPGISFGIGLITEIELDPLWPIVVWGHFWSPTLTTDVTSLGQWEAWTFGAAACRIALPGNVFTLFGCVGGLGGSISSRGGVSVNSPLYYVEPYAEIDARLGARLRVVGPLVTRLAFGAGVPLARYRYYYPTDTPQNLVFPTGIIATTAEIGLEFRAPW